MAVGDFVGVGTSGQTCRVHRLVARISEGATAESFAHDRQFIYLPIRPVRRRGWVLSAIGLIPRILRLDRAWRWLRRTWDARPKSLLQVMGASHDVGFQQTLLGAEAIGVPFPHVLILTDKDRRSYRTALESHLESQLDRWWGNYVDRFVGFRVRMMKARTRENELVVYFGDGIFVPGSAERPTGRVEIVFKGRTQAFEPKISGEIPGGLYRGQSALAFSGSERLTPAATEALSGAPGIFCLRARPHDETSFNYVLDWDAAGHGEDVFAPDIRESVPPPPGADGAFQVQFSGAEPFDVRLVEDTRPSRHLSAAPDTDDALAIVGILEPPQIKGSSVERWWIDIDRNGGLVASAMRLARQSLLCQDSELSIWDWATPRNPAGYAGTLEPCETADGPRMALMAPPGAPLGWLRAPQRTVRATFAPSVDAAYNLDWLDLAGAVQDRSYKSVRLAAYWQQSKLPVFVPGPLGGEGSELLLMQIPGQPMYVSGWRGAWRAGTRFIVGPLLLEIGTSRGAS